MPIPRTEVLRMLEGYELTDFQKEVLIVTAGIERGNTLTYKQVAEKIGHGKAYRAVGTALKKNPLAPKIPCHRVIKSDGSVGNYSGKGGAGGKRELLIREFAISGD
jgi:methylated-DNA-[protein]-cysteine S-methyltransferase